jgi:hypothetical protein
MAAKKKTLRKRTDPELIMVGLATHELASLYRERMEARLPPGMLSMLLGKITMLRTARPEAIGAVLDKTASTVAQNESAAHAHGIIVAIRDALVGSKMDPETKKAWGVGTKIRPDSVPLVLAAGQVLLARATSHPDEATAAGVLPRDLEALRVALASLVTADATLDGKKISSRGVLAARNAARRTIEDAVSLISALGRLEFVHKPNIADRFGALIARSTPEDRPATA